MAQPNRSLTSFPVSAKGVVVRDGLVMLLKNEREEGTELDPVGCGASGLHRVHQDPAEFLAHQLVAGLVDAGASTGHRTATACHPGEAADTR